MRARGEGAKVLQFGRVFRTDDEPKMMTVVLAAFDEGGSVRCVGARVEHARFLLVAGDAFSPQIVDVCRERRRSKGMPPVTNDARLNDNAPRA